MRVENKIGSHTPLTSICVAPKCTVMQELNLCVRNYYDTSYYRAMSNVAERTFRVI